MPYKDFKKQKQAQRKYVNKHRKKIKLWQHEYYLRNRKHELARARKWRRLHSTERKEYQLKYHYGITINEYNTLFKKQNGRCLICNIHQLKEAKSLSVDHCHKTNKIRGLLCINCNRALGYFKDNLDIVKRAVLYLKKSI